jgi:RNA polymerase sigma factor (sigma-70 family)
MEQQILDSVCDRGPGEHAGKTSTTIQFSHISADAPLGVRKQLHRSALSEPRSRQSGPHESAHSPAHGRKAGLRHGIRTADVDRDVLYGSFQALVHQLISRYGDDPDLREELNTEIYYRFCKLLTSYDITRNIPLRPYLVCQLTSSVYTFVRQRRISKQREVNLELDPDSFLPALAADPSEQWDDNLMFQELCRHLPSVMQRLTLRQRQVVTWRYYEERSYEDIAAELNVQPATARSILRFSLRNMRRMLEEDNIPAGQNP